MSDEVPEFLLCPIGQTLMRDPVLTLDGHSFERATAEAWFQALEAEGKPIASPLTGAQLQSRILIPNRALKAAILHFLHSHPTVADAVAKEVPFDLPKVATLQAGIGYQGERKGRGEENPVFLSSTQGGQGRRPGAVSTSSVAFSLSVNFEFSKDLAGSRVDLSEDRTVARRVGTPMEWTEALVFVSRPLKLESSDLPVVEFEIFKSETGWGGLTLGLSTTPPSAIKRDVSTHLDEACWWLDSSSWLHLPGEGSSLSSFNLSDLRQGERVALVVPEDGRLLLFVGGRKKMESREARISLRGNKNLYAFLGLTGNVAEVRVCAPSFRYSQLI